MRADYLLLFSSHSHSIQVHFRSVLCVVSLVAEVLGRFGARPSPRPVPQEIRAFELVIPSLSGWGRYLIAVSRPAKLIFVCGKMAAGKSTLARALAQREDAVLLVQDELLAALFPEEITGIGEFVKYSGRVRSAIASHVCSLLARGISVVLDFPANTNSQRAWFRDLFERVNVGHELHFIDASDSLCKAQLKDRSRHLPPGAAWTSDAEFDAITRYFQPPADDEGFNVILHTRA